ncbi:MAG: hypothetical protein DU480_14545 [Nitrosomonas sp.]|uniref:hypothetical protein n=1 Tax=Nitrosomonas sp. TaxID=42353 RepID=UPI0032EF3630
MAEHIPIFRGFHIKLHDGTIENIFKNNPRCPIDTDKVIHTISDSWFYARFDIYARSQTLICTTDIVQAIKYKSEDGSLGKITLIDPYKVIYSENVRDFLECSHEIDNPSEEKVHECLQSKNFQCVSDINSISSSFKGEIMIDCKEYYLHNI